MLEIKMTPEEVVVVIAGEATLPWIASGLQHSIEFFLGQGITKMEFVRKRAVDGGHCVIIAKAMSKPKDFAFSNMSQLIDLAKDGYFPQSLDDAWTEHSDGLAKLGQSKYTIIAHHGYALTGKPISDIVFHRRGHNFVSLAKDAEKLSKTAQNALQNILELCVNELAYSIADIITGFMYQGCTIAKWQGSMEYAQLLIEGVGFNQKELNHYLSQSQNYDINTKVKDIPLEFNPEWN